MNTAAGEHDYAAQEVMLLLLGIPLHASSRTTVTVRIGSRHSRRWRFPCREGQDHQALPPRRARHALPAAGGPAPRSPPLGALRHQVAAPHLRRDVHLLDHPDFTTPSTGLLNGATAEHDHSASRSIIPARAPSLPPALVVQRLKNAHSATFYYVDPSQHRRSRTRRGATPILAALRRWSPRRVFPVRVRRPRQSKMLRSRCLTCALEFVGGQTPSLREHQARDAAHDRERDPDRHRDELLARRIVAQRRLAHRARQEPQPRHVELSAHHDQGRS